MKKIKLSSIFDIARGGSPRPIQDYLTDDKNGINWIMIGDTIEGNKYIEKTAKKIKPSGIKKSRKVYVGDFLLTNSMSFGRPYILKIDGCIHDGWLVLSPRSPNISTDYFYYLLSSQELKSEMGKQAAGAVVKNLNSDIVRNIEVKYPDLPTQTKIAKILDKADQIRQKRKKAIELADEFLRSLFLEMFGDPVVNPKGWITKPIKEVINNFNEKDNYKDNDNIWLLNLDMIKSHTGEIIEKQFCQYKNLNNSTRYFDGSTILYNKLRPYLNKVVIPKENEHGYCTTELVALQPNTQFIDRYFLAYYLRSKEFLEWAEIKVAGAKMPRLNMNDFWMKDIYIPSLELQNKFAQIVKKTEFKKRKLQSQLKNMDELFNSLSQQYFTKVE